ncbi:MAG TPA: nucleotidyltransferase domain-containing protein [Candidatus Nanoarchaeia archaeon]|nr:nucleotidyltransferase domain-containing protein [Candidatus Nanoarchaeia archaeon]
MYLNTLSKTAENILAFLLNNLDKDYSIREIAKELGQDYKIVFTTIKQIASDGIITMKRVSNINRCQALVTKENAALLAYISQRKAQKTLPKKISQALKEAVQGITNPFYTLLIFGSHAKGSARPSSDIDILAIVQEKGQEQEIRSAIKRSATLNNLQINPVILTIEEFQAGRKEPSVSKEAYEKHLIIHGGESFYLLIAA